MTFNEHKIFVIDDYILLKNRGNEFISLIEHYFREEKLTFSLLEMVLLNENGIGETYIYAYKDFDSKKFYKQYIELIKKFKEDFNGGVSSYREWYKKNTWILIGSGKDTITSFNYDLSNYDWVGEFEPKPIRSYGKQYGLTNEIIGNYFNSYANSIRELELGNHPNYFIIIHPISKLHNGNTIPYGNLYLHFATIEKVELESVKGFLREFMVIWYKNYGGHHLKSAVQKLVTKVLLNTEVCSFLPKEFGSHLEKLEVAFVEYFFPEDRLENFKEKVVAFKAMLSELNSIKNNEIISSKSIVSSYLKSPTYTTLLDNFSAENFEQFIFKRALAIYLLFCKELTVNETKDFLGKKVKTSNLFTTQLAYFNQYCHLFFPMYDDRKKSISYETELRNKFETTQIFSDFELSIIKEFQQKQKS